MNIQDILSSPVFWIIFAASSELIGLSKYRDNSVIQLVMSTVRKLKPTKKD